MSNATLKLPSNYAELTEKIWNELNKDSSFSEVFEKEQYNFDTFSNNIQDKLKVVTSLTSTEENKVVLWANVVVDVLMCLALIFDIRLKKNQAAVNAAINEARVTEKLISKVARLLVDLQSGSPTKMGNALLKLIQIIYSMYGPASIKNIVVAMAKDMHWWEIALTVAEFIAWIAVIVVSDGGAIIARIAPLGVSLGILINDIVKLVDSYNATEEIAINLATE